MSKKSDSQKPESLREARVSATEASRSFSELLDRIELGQSFTVHRHGKDVCVMIAPTLSGRRASECRELLRGVPDSRLDDEFGSDLLDVILTERSEERPSWDS